MEAAAQGRKLVNWRFENPGKDRDSSRGTECFYDQAMNIRKRNKKCDHACCCDFDLLLWRLRASGKQEFFHSSYPYCLAKGLP